ncbi:MAG: oxidoreductase [Cyanobacteria bacterium P01_F01_bin.116]
MDQKTVLITGASSGIGKVTAKMLIAEGYTVYAAARSLEKMEDLKNLGGMPIKMDITQEDDVVAAIEQIRQNHGGVDILINGAGIPMFGAMEDIPLDDARYLFEVNLFGLARLTQLALPGMRQKKAGKIVNISSMAGKIYAPLGAWYHATKHALEGWSDCLRLETKPFNIDVIIIEPGAIGNKDSDDFIKPMLEQSGEGAYGDIVHAFARVSRKTYDASNIRSSSSIVAETISKAIKAKRPTTRYRVGKLATPLILTRTRLGDRVYDWLLSKMFA